MIADTDPYQLDTPRSQSLHPSPSTPLKGVSRCLGSLLHCILSAQGQTGNLISPMTIIRELMAQRLGRVTKHAHVPHFFSRANNSLEFPYTTLLSRPVCCSASQGSTEVTLPGRRGHSAAPPAPRRLAQLAPLLQRLACRRYLFTPPHLLLCVLCF